MSRTRSIRCAANTNVVKILNQFKDANRGSFTNPCTFRGMIINVLNPGANGQSAFKIYDNNLGTGFTVPAAVAVSASNKTITLSSGTWEDKGLAIGKKILISSSDESGNDGTKTIVNLTSTVITVAETMDDDASDTNMTIDSAGGDTDGLIGQFTINFTAGGVSGLTLVNEVDGIACSEGLRIEAASWTNLEVFVLVG